MRSGGVAEKRRKGRKRQKWVLSLPKIWTRFARVANGIGFLAVAGFVLFVLGAVSGLWDETGLYEDDDLVSGDVRPVMDSVIPGPPVAGTPPVSIHKITPPPSSSSPAQDVQVDILPNKSDRIASPKNQTMQDSAHAALSADHEQPVIVLVIDDLGINQTLTRQVAQLDGPLTMAFLPYANDLQNQADFARKNGHELLMHMPMEPKGDDADPGPMALLSHLDDQAFLERLNWNLARFSGFTGINNHMGSRLTEDRRAMSLVMTRLKAGGLTFVDSRTTADSVAADLAQSYGVPHLSRDIFLDNDQSLDAIMQQLGKLERIATRTGLAVGIGHPYSETIEALRMWLPQAKQRGLVLVPLRQAIERHGTGNARRVSSAP